MSTNVQDDAAAAFVAQFKPLVQNGESSLAPEARQKALNALGELDIPTRKVEAWKYTNLKRITQTSYRLGVGQSVTDISPYLIPGLEADVLVFVNGIFDESLSQLADQNGLEITNLHTLSEGQKEEINQRMGQIAAADADIFNALNTAFVQEGVLIKAGRNQATERPVHILHLSHPAEDRLAMQHRNLFVAEQGAEVKVVESFHSLSGGNSLRNLVTEIFVEQNAGLEYIKLQLESDQASQVDRTEVFQAGDSRFSIHTITMHGELIRNHLRIHLGGENITSELKGLYLLDGQQHVDNFTQVEHAKPHCYSNELYKGIVTDQSTAVFNGRIHVYEDAQKTNAFQSNRNIVLSNDANIYTKPQLEIYADDVKCSHGATTGRLDESAMFYLMARGIKEEAARIMLVYAFAMEVADDISLEPVKDFISNLIENRFSAN
ncbi:MAG: Fe-S cluster assembly protein SufD [Bacteroidota bacterium]